MAKGAPTEEKMQIGVDQVSDSCDSYDFTISIRDSISANTWKALQGAYHHSERSTTASEVDKFTYLGSTLSRIVHIDDDVNAKIAKDNAAFGRLCGSIWDQSGIKLDTKLKVY